MLPEYTPGANLYDYAFYGNMQTDDNVNTFRYQVGGTPWSQQQQQQQQGGGNEQLIEYIQMYSEITQQDPNDIYEKVSSMSQEDQQAALQEIVGTIQEYYTMQQSRQQDQMVDEQGESMYGDEEEDEYASPQKPIVSPTPDEIAGLEEEAEYDAAVEAATADYDEEYMYGGSKKRGRNKFTSQLKKAARGMAQEMVNTDSVPTGTSSYGGERLKKFVSGIQRNVANNMAEEAFNQSMDYFEQPEMMRYGGLPRYEGSTDGSQTTGNTNTQTTQNITLTPEQFNQLLARQYSNQGYYPGNYGGYGGRGLGSLLHMFGAAPISNDWYMPRGYRMTNRSQKDLKDQLMLSGKIPLEASYLSNVEATKGFLGNIYNPRKVSMTFSRALPQINAPGSSTSTSVTPAENAPSSWNQDIRVNTNPSDITIPPVTIGSGTQTSSSPANPAAAQSSGSNTSAQNNTSAAIGVPPLLDPKNVSTTQPFSFNTNYLRTTADPQTVDISGVGPIDLSNQDEIDALNIREENILQRSYNNNSSIQKTGYKNPKLFQKGGSTLYDIVKSKGYDPSFESRKKIFQDYFDEPYTGTYEQNAQLRNKLLSGDIQLINKKPNQTASAEPVKKQPVQKSKIPSTIAANNQVVKDFAAGTNEMFKGPGYYGKQVSTNTKQKVTVSKEVQQAKKQNIKEINKVKVETPPLLKRRSFDVRDAVDNSLFGRGEGYYEDDLRNTLESGVIVDKATGTINFVREGKIDQKFPVLTGLAGKNYETDPNVNPYKVPYLRNNPAARSTPTGTYKMKYDKSIYGWPGYLQQPIAAFGKKAPIATTPLAMHIVYGAGAKPGYTWDPSQGKGAKPYYNPEEYQSRLERFSQPDNRFGSYGCTNFEPYSLECLTERFGTEGDTAVYIDSRNPEDKRFIEKFPVAPPLKNRQKGGQLYLYRTGGLPTFQNTGEYVVPKQVKDYVTSLVQEGYNNPSLYSRENPQGQNNIRTTSRFIAEENIPGSIMLPGQIGPLNEGQSQMEDFVGRSRYPETVNISGKTFGDINPMEEFDTSLLDQQRKTVNLPTKSLQEVTAEAGANPSMKTLKADFVKNPLSASQWADIAYSGTNLVTNLKNRADQELAQAQMLERETDPINYTPSTFANFDGGIEANLGDTARNYTSFMGQRQQFSPGVTSGFGKFGGVLKYGGTYEMDLSPEEIAYIQQMGGTIEYI
jgi:hypothetical protein